MLSVVSQFQCCYLPEVNLEESTIACDKFSCMKVHICKTCGRYGFTVASSKL